MSLGSAAYFENRTDPFLVSVGPGFSFPPHLHPQLELLYVQAGRVRVTVREQQAELSAGGLAVVFPNQIHSYQAREEDARVTMLICDTAYAGCYLDALTRLHPSNPFLARPHPNAVYAIEELAKECAAGKSSPVRGPLVQLLLARAMPEFRLHQNRAADSQNLVWRVASYIGGHYREPMTLDTLAKGVGISRYYLSRVFSEKMGQGFSSYLASIRLSYALTLLAETKRTVTEIAEEAGFDSQRTFYRAFRAHYGMSPAEYRRGRTGSGNG